MTGERDSYRYKVLFESEKEAETARKFDSWVDRAISRAFLVRPRLVSVVRIDHIFKSAVLSDISTTKLRNSLAMEIAKDNGNNVRSLVPS